MEPMTALAIGSSVVGFFGANSAAKAAKREAALQRRQLRHKWKVPNLLHYKNIIQG